MTGDPNGWTLFYENGKAYTLQVSEGGTVKFERACEPGGKGAASSDCWAVKSFQKEELQGAQQNEQGDYVIPELMIPGGFKLDQPPLTIPKDFYEKEILEPSLSITKTVDKTTAQVGDTLTYTITVTNDGKGDAADIVLKDTFSGAGALSFQKDGNDFDLNTKLNVPAGQSVVITAVYVVSEGDAGKTLTNRVEIDGTNRSANAPGVEVKPKAPELVTVTYRIVGGTWSDGKTDDRTETVEKGKTPKQIPTGMQPASGYQRGSWNPQPGTAVSTDTIYTYVFEKCPTYSLTYDANGGAWESDVAGYTMNDGKTTAAQTMAKGTVIAQIGTSPVRAGKQFTGWYYDEDCTEPVVFTSAARLYHDLTLYAGWKDIPADYVTYTIRQHYIGADGEEDRAVNIINLSAEKGTVLLALYQHLRQNVTFPDTGLTYLFLAAGTKITPASADDTLTQPTTIDLYYALDTWKDGAQIGDRNEPDSLTGGDGVPDYQQAVIQFTSDPNGTLSGPTVQVFTLTAQVDADGRYLDEITPETVTPEPKTDFTFVCWTKGAEEGAVTPFEPQTLYGGDEITYTAHFTGVQKTAYFTVEHYLVDAAAPFAVNDRDYRELGTVLAAGDFAKQPFVTVEDRHYAYDHADPYTLTVGADEAQNVLKLYYAPDEIGGGADLDQPDGVPDQYQVTIRYQSETGGTITGMVKEVVTLKDPNGGWTVTGDAPARGSQVERSSSRYRFDGWTKDWTNETDGFVSGEETLAPFTIRNAAGGKTYTVTAEFYKRSSSGSSDSSKDDDKTPDLEKGDHYAYIVGYAEDGTVRPNANITRAEVAAIFFRLLTDDARDAYWCTSNRFPDVTPDAWYNNAVSTVANAGILVGNPDGTFRPNANITRAEFAAIAARFLSDPSEGRDRFTDTANHWARALINQAAAEKWITGYKDGTFRPDNAITRAEAVTLINNVLERGPDADHMLKKMVTWPDNADRSAWYYEAIQEATNSHDYTWSEDDDSEKWTKLLETRDWPALEREWSSKHAGKGEIDIDDGPSI